MQITKIIIGIDSNDIAEHAATYGFEMARKFNAKVGLVHIIEPNIMAQQPNDGLMGNMTPDIGTVDVELMDIQNQASEKLIARITEKFGTGVNVTHFSEYGDTADGIVACCNEFGADMIVIGTHNRTGIDRFLMGSVAEHVVRHAHVPVLVVPMPKSND